MERVLVVSNSNELVRMKPERIAYISSDGNYVTVVLHDRTEQELVLSDSRLDGAFRLSASREALRQLKELLEKEAGL